LFLLITKNHFVACVMHNSSFDRCYSVSTMRI